MNFKDMMQQAQQMQFKLEELQEKMKDIEVEGEAGGGMVKVTMSCGGEVRAIAIDSSVINVDDKETLEDLIVAAMNNANDAKDERIKTETTGMMEGLGLPAGTKLPF
ncbi:MAG TPA: YbaB/EbfC family nucleoid-associated protein [Alphaproteobacteria bacterium]|nr:YbaB/EbfC family nucleoid-associated protein [Alphaproteobacteria bacterium]USO06752.1 MAG: YbaB/EbfC family nucleoid-associated protein [Rhodospirillales bacterium]HOO81300.1 YbaB/EbfC family nucleoid-associated protein [Alphaproteobacteria bacterium]